jgi:hypothetical protein
MSEPHRTAGRGDTVPTRPQPIAQKTDAELCRAVTNGIEQRLVKLTVNGRSCALTVEPRTTLLEALRGQLALTGTKKSCEQYSRIFRRACK